VPHPFRVLCEMGGIPIHSNSDPEAAAGWDTTNPMARKRRPPGRPVPAPQGLHDRIKR
jgi:hypothetical protein